MTSGFAFRAQLVFRDQRQIYDYWRTCAEMRKMPARRDIDPGSLRAYLPQISLIDIFEGVHTAVFRLAGTRLREFYGLELTGKRLGDLEWGDKRDYWQDIYGDILKCAEPCVGVVHGPLTNREHVTLYWLRLPLSDDGVRVNKILCYDIAAPNSSAGRAVSNSLNGEVAVSA